MCCGAAAFPLEEVEPTRYPRIVRRENLGRRGRPAKALLQPCIAARNPHFANLVLNDRIVLLILTNGRNTGACGVAIRPGVAGGHGESSLRRTRDCSRIAGSSVEDERIGG